MTKTNYLFAELKFRKESKIILIPNIVINYFSKGLIDNSKLKNEQLLENYKKQQETSIIQSPSEATSEIYDKTIAVESFHFFISPIMKRLEAICSITAANAENIGTTIAKSA